MSIPESQLETWSHQGSIQQSSATYNTIRNVLQAGGTPYSSKDVSLFLQGSYGNDTNIYAESDVDIVVQLNDCFHSDISELPEVQKAVFNAARSAADYGHADFKRDVFGVLKAAYGDAVKDGHKAISIAPNGNRRKADVIVAVQFRRYYRFTSASDVGYHEGMCFFDSAGQMIANYPKQHSDNLTTKHRDANQWFKPMVRVLKNLRSKLVDEKVIAGDLAPSYYLEGLLYNVPDKNFGSTYTESLCNSITWILEADRSKFLCANRLYYLLWENSPVAWRASKCDEFLKAVVKLWKEW
jgi:hypothetical protein